MIDRAERMAAIRAAAHRVREDREIASELETPLAGDNATAPIVAPATRCPHSTKLTDKPGPCSLCLMPAVRRIAPGTSGGVDRQSFLPAHVNRPRRVKHTQTMTPDITPQPVPDADRVDAATESQPAQTVDATEAR